MGRNVDYEEVRDLRDQILREMHAGFAGVHARQDRTNGRIDHLQEQAGDFGGRITSLEGQANDFHQHRRASDVVTPLSPEPERRAITRWDVKLVATSLAGGYAVLKFLQWIGSAFVSKP